MTDPELVVIRTYPDQISALLARATLMAHDIGVLLLRDDAGGMLPSLAILSEFRLAVPRDDAVVARSILTSAEL